MTQHEITVQWHDSAPALAALPKLSGLEFMKKMADGELPGAPIASHFGMEVINVESGSVTFRCTPDESHYNPIGTIHGGLVCTMLDSALGCATHTTLPAGTGYTSIEIKVNFLRPVSAGNGALICRGRVTKPDAGSLSPRARSWTARARWWQRLRGALLIFPIQER